MTQITWKNIDAPNLAPAIQGMNTGVNTAVGLVENLGKFIQERAAKQQEAAKITREFNTNQALMETQLRARDNPDFIDSLLTQVSTTADPNVLLQQQLVAPGVAKAYAAVPGSEVPAQPTFDRAALIQKIMTAAPAIRQDKLLRDEQIDKSAYAAEVPTVNDSLTKMAQAKTLKDLGAIMDNKPQFQSLRANEEFHKAYRARLDIIPEKERQSAEFNMRMQQAGLGLQLTRQQLENSKQQAAQLKTAKDLAQAQARLDSAFGGAIYKGPAVGNIPTAFATLATQVGANTKGWTGFALDLNDGALEKATNILNSMSIALPGEKAGAPGTQYNTALSEKLLGELVGSQLAAGSEPGVLSAVEDFRDAVNALTESRGDRKKFMQILDEKGLDYNDRSVFFAKEFLLNSIHQQESLAIKAGNSAGPSDQAISAIMRTVAPAADSTGTGAKKPKLTSSQKLLQGSGGAGGNGILLRPQ